MALSRGSLFAGPDADGLELEGDVDQDQFGGDVGRAAQLDGPVILAASPVRELVAVERQAAIDHVQVAASARPELVLAAARDRSGARRAPGRPGRGRARRCRPGP